MLILVALILYIITRHRSIKIRAHVPLARLALRVRTLGVTRLVVATVCMVAPILHNPSIPSPHRPACLEAT